MDLLIATTNEGKVIEIREALSDLPLTLLSLKDLPTLPSRPEEVGETLEENAILKARYYFARTRLPLITDDSGIRVEALEGDLGMHTRRWGAGPEASDAEWIETFLERMAHEECRNACFTCVIAFVDAAGNLQTFEGTCEGEITSSLEAPYLPGLPISACFRPLGHSKVFSALSPAEKNDVSHRGRALRLLRTHLPTLLTPYTSPHSVHSLQRFRDEHGRYRTDLSPA